MKYQIASATIAKFLTIYRHLVASQITKKASRLNNEGKVHAFTLVETVVVVAIIIVVSATIAVVLLSSLARAKKSRSLQNLKNIGQATAIYAVDFDDMLPPYCSSLGNPIVVDGVSDHPLRFWKDVLRKYKITEEEFYAPLDPNKKVSADIRQIPDGSAHLYSSYVHSNALVKFGSGKLLSMSMSQVPERAKAVYMLESGKGWITRPGGGEQVMQPYDDMSAMALFLDGHVEALPKQY